MGKKTGAYETVISSDPAMFEEAKLKDFDAVVLLSTTGEGFGLKQGVGTRFQPRLPRFQLYIALLRHEFHWMQTARLPFFGIDPDANPLGTEGRRAGRPMFVHSVRRPHGPR